MQAGLPVQWEPSRLFQFVPKQSQSIAPSLTCESLKVPVVPAFNGQAMCGSSVRPQSVPMAKAYPGIKCAAWESTVQCLSAVLLSRWGVSPAAA